MQLPEKKDAALKAKEENDPRPPAKPEEEKKPADQAAAQPNQDAPKLPEKTTAPSANKSQNFDNNKNGFFNMITGFLGFLNLRKQAYVGKPAEAMYYDEKKGRYVIAGEEESDDDEPPPPPPGARKMGVEGGDGQGAAGADGQEKKA